MTRYFNEWERVEDLRKDFEIAESDVQDAEVLWAYYDAEGYEGSARVILQREGRVYEVRGSHCSYMGLEGQWEPEEVSWEQLALRPVEEQVDYGGSEAIAAWTEMVNQHVPRA